MAAKKGNAFQAPAFGTASRPLRQPINDRNRSRNISWFKDILGCRRNQLARLDCPWAARMAHAADHAFIRFTA
ncbi:hypothetical protein [Rhizobium binae]|uniref:hypothetical protein n=1 Tax=Rhizobium binae TaxID=1138190 RepID=UPI001C82D072|nr:hypothetical protein [Rhizobium binae]MBX4936088.1 hypothetical protein [Rhizobium binae]MBX4942127.1 hypothetical protein [Rhizobium binae]MBX4962272.1 hypothetical protein [Rhizobium binae]MBX4978018.1 hypothetical protein [Rhizobium binae]